MIQMQSMLDVADNTGAKSVMCFKVLGGSKRRYAGIGDVIIGSVKKSIPTANVRKGAIVRGVIVTGHQVLDGQKRDPSSRRLAPALRPQRRRDHRQGRQPGGHAHLRPGGP